MSLLQAFVLGLIQGLTEFLPVSSSGHLIIVPYLVHWETQPIYFDVALHWGTLIAVGSYFWKDWMEMVQVVLKQKDTFKKQPFMKYPVELRLFLLIVLGTIPAVILGFLFQDVIENTLRSPYVVIFMLVLVAFFMWWAQEKPRVVKKLSISFSSWNISFRSYYFNRNIQRSFSRRCRSIFISSLHSNYSRSRNL